MSVASASAAGTIRLAGELEVNRLGLGAMRLTGDGIWGEPDDRDAAIALLRRAVELGVNFIDTADSYGPHVSERLIADALRPYPDDLVIATKGGLLRGGPGHWQRDCSPDHLREACEGSLERLGLDRIDLYQLHAIDPKVPLEDSVGALAQLQQEGMIRFVGVSNFDPDELRRAREIVGVVSVQNRYSPTVRQSEPTLERCEQDGIAYIPYFPLDAGDATRSGGPLERLGREHYASAAQAAIAWLLARSPLMLPIPGTSSIAHLEENIAAASIRFETLPEL